MPITTQISFRNMVRRPYSSSESGSDNDPAFNEHFLDVLAEMRADEIASLTQWPSKLRAEGKESWIIRSLAMFQQYLSFLFETWLKAAWACFFYPSSKFSLLPSYATLISSYTAIVDRIAVVILSSAACVIISVLLLWCLLCNFPSIHRLYDWYLRRFSNGSSLMRHAFKLLFLTFVIMPNRCPKNVRRAE